MPRIVDHDARRRDFIQAAYETIIEEGFDKTTVRGVAKKAGYTTGALVHYFKDKDELIRAALNHFGEEVRERMAHAHEARSGRAALRATLIEVLPTNRRAAMSWRVWLALWYHSEADADMRDEQRRRYREWFGRVREMLEESRATGELGQDLDTTSEARGVVAFVDGLGVQYLMSNGRLSKRWLVGMIDSYLARLYAD
ncbi:MAG: TetR/AcrR family transcriptional regulator [Pseudomonadales bacterium]